MTVFSRTTEASRHTFSPSGKEGGHLATSVRLIRCPAMPVQACVSHYGPLTVQRLDVTRSGFAMLGGERGRLFRPAGSVAVSAGVACYSMEEIELRRDA